MYETHSLPPVAVGPRSVPPEAGEEVALIEGLLADDNRSWRLFQDRYSNFIKGAIGRVRSRFASVMTVDDTGEIYGNLCLQLLSNDKRRLRSFDPSRGTRFESWLCLLARHAAYDFLRSRRRQPQVHWLSEELSGLDSLTEDAPDAFRICCAREQARVLVRLLEDLSPRDQEFVSLYYCQGLEPEQTADRLGICVGTVYSKKHKIRARIEALLEKRLAA